MLCECECECESRRYEVVTYADRLSETRLAEVEALQLQVYITQHKLTSALSGKLVHNRIKVDASL